MPVAVSYPGVYIEEIPSGVRTITGVATSIAAFVGWAPNGPTDRAELVLSWSDFARKFGGLTAQPAGIRGLALLRQRRAAGVHRPPGDDGSGAAPTMPPPPR